MSKNIITRYREHVDLNPDTASTGSITCYDGEVTYDNKPFQDMFVEIADCHGKIKIHRATYDNVCDYHRKLLTMITTLTKYANHIRENMEDIQRLVDKDD